jgi:transcriptional regulator with XRE-family HTH domain
MAPKLTTEADIRIGARVRAAREAARMSQSDLARILGVSFQQVQKYERGRNRLCGSRLQVIANHLGLTVADLYDDPAPVPPRKLSVSEALEALEAAAKEYAEAVERAALPLRMSEAA